MNKDICPDDNELTYVDGEVHCSKHDNLETEETPEEVPWIWLDQCIEVSILKGKRGIAL